MNLNTVIISRTDAIGDVVLTLPMARLIKDLYKNVKIVFFGRSYTRPVIDCCTEVDEFINYDEFAKEDLEGKKNFLKKLNADAIIHVFPRQDISSAARAAEIRLRIGATGRLHHWFNCNRLVRMSRKKSDLHEAQLNIKLLKPLGHSGNISTEELSKLYSMKVAYSLPTAIYSHLAKDKFKLIVHPKSNASAREWSLDNYALFIRMLPEEKFQVILTGGENEKEAIDQWHTTLPQNVLNLAGKLSLNELISLLNSVDGIIAASTGPLHIASSLGKFALGIYPPIRPMDPGRWAPIGKNADYIVLNKSCSDCRYNAAACHCMNEITPSQVMNKIKGTSNNLS